MARISGVVAALVAANLAVVVGPAGVVAPAAASSPLCANGNPIYRVTTTKKVVAFTFDDGPSPRYTAKIMSAFESHGWRATFFMVGENIKAYPAVARSVAARGHDIGNHSMTHTYSSSAIIREIRPTNDLIKSVTGIHPAFMRPPGLLGGARLTRAIYANGMCNIATSNNMFDWMTPRPSAVTLCGRMYWALRPGAIILLHDGGSHKTTADAVPCMLRYAAAKGYTVVSLRDLLAHNF